MSSPCRHPRASTSNSYLASRDDLTRDRLPVTLRDAGDRTRRPRRAAGSTAAPSGGCCADSPRRPDRRGDEPHVLRDTYATLAGRL